MKQRELTFEQLKEVLSIEHDPQIVTELMKDYCLRSLSPDIQKKGMEFLYMNGYDQELEILIKKNRQHADLSNTQWAAVYQLILDRKMERYPPDQIIQILDQITTTDAALICVIEITKVSSYVDMQKFSELGEFLEVYQRWFDRISDQSFLAFLNIRLDQIMMSYYLTRNELILARRYAYRLLNHAENTQRTKLIAHTQLGFSYLFEDYFQAMFHMQEALQVAHENNFKKSVYAIKNNNIPFICAHFNQVERVTTEDRSEQAHIEIAKGNNQNAIEILSDLQIDSPFRMYYMGRAKQDKDLLMRSVKSFVEERGDYFFSQLPLREICKMA